MIASIRNIPDEIIRHIYGYIGDINTESGIGSVLGVSSVCREWLGVAYAMDMKHRYIVNSIKEGLPGLIEDLNTLEGVSSLYEDTIIAINQQRPTINKATLSVLRDTSNRIKNTTGHFSKILRYGDDRLNFCGMGIHSMVLCMTDIKQAASYSYILSGLSSFKNKYNNILVAYMDMISNI